MTESSWRDRAADLADDPLWRWVVPVALTTLSAILYLSRLDEPARIIFDETYYVNDARQYLDALVEQDFAVHPPVGKWLIAAGIAVFGDSAVGWRIVGAAAGTASVLLTYLIGLRLFRHVGYAALAALLLATDGLFFVQARTSMLDIHLAFFVVLGVYLLLVDHDRTGLYRSPPDDPIDGSVAGSDEASDDGDLGTRPSRSLPRRSHVVRMLAGVAFGLAIATKWSGLLALGAAGLITLGAELVHRHRWTGSWRTQLRPMIASVGVGLVLIPAGVYVLSYVPWIANYEYSHEGRKECEDDAGEVRDPCDVTIIDRYAGLVRYQRSIWNFHDSLEATHPYRAPATTWPVMGRPVVYYWETCTGDRAAGVASTDDETGEVTEPEPCVVAEEDAAEIIAVGNPALWWGFLLGSVLVIAGAIRRERAAAVIATFYALQVIPWLVVSRPVFFFYMVPVVPFLALGLAYAASTLSRRWAVASSFAGAGIGGALGFGLAVGATNALGAETKTAWWLAMAGGWVVGAAVGAVIDRRHDHQVRRRWAAATPAAWTGIAIATLAVLAFLYFLPVWTGIHMTDDAVRQRWWFDSWI